MSVTQEFWDTLRKLSALEARTNDVVRALERIGDKVDYLIDRLSRIEVQHQTLRETVRSEILSDLKAEIAVLKLAMSQLPVNAPPRRAQEIEVPASALLTGE